jgi:5-methyltetrahydrofolate--homocysteine methyltransferase
MAQYVHLALNSGAKIVGGCCCTSFEHIRAMRKAMDEHQMNGMPSLMDIESKVGEMSSGSKAIFAGNDSAPIKKRRSRRSR